MVLCLVFLVLIRRKIMWSPFPPNLSWYSCVVVLVFWLWLPPNLSCLQNNPPENNVESVPAESEPGYLRFGGNWFHIIFRRIVLEAAQIWRELVPHNFLADCFGGSSELAGTGFTLFSGKLFSWQLSRIVLGSISFRLKKFFWRLFQVVIDVLQFVPCIRFTRNRQIFTRDGMYQI